VVDIHAPNRAMDLVDATLTNSCAINRAHRPENAQYLSHTATSEEQPPALAKTGRRKSRKNSRKNSFATKKELPTPLEQTQPEQQAAEQEEARRNQSRQTQLLPGMSVSMSRAPSNATLPSSPELLPLDDRERHKPESLDNLF